MHKPDSRDRLSVPSFELKNGADKRQRPIESTPPKKLREEGAEASLEGTTLDKRFRILERVGQGGMSEVYKAEHIMLQKMVAIKVLHKQQEAEGIERFQQEAKAISSLDHRNIVKVYAFGASEQDRLYLAMDFLEGKSLSDILESEERLSWRKTVAYALQIAQGLEQAHTRGIVHRDLKPSNIIIETDEYNNEIVKVVDFGIAKLTQESGKEVKNLTQDGNTCGSPPYMSPEQCMGELADARSDVYSFGIMLYELLTGVRPITGRSALEMMQNHLEQTPAFFERSCPDAGIPNSLETIVRKCLQKERDDRYQSMAEIQKDLKLIGSYSDEENELEETNKKALGTTHEIERKERKKFVIAAAAAATTLAIGCSAVFYFCYLPQKELSDLKTSVEKMDLKDPKYIDKIGVQVPQLLNKLDEKQGKAPGMAVIRKLRKRINALPDGCNKWIGLSKLSEQFQRYGLEEEANDLINRAIGGLHIYGEEMRLKAKNYPEAQRALQHCVGLSIKYNKSKTFVLNVMNLLFTAYIHNDNFSRAEHISRSAIEYALDGGNDLERCGAYFNLANVLHATKRYSEAELAYRESWKYSNQLGNAALAKNIAVQLAENLRLQGKLEEAQSLQTQM